MKRCVWEQEKDQKNGGSKFRKNVKSLFSASIYQEKAFKKNKAVMISDDALA